MQLTTLAGTTLRISPICLGTAAIGHAISEEESFALLDRFTELGGNFVDTARIYSDWVPGERGRGERILGDWMRSRRIRDHLVIATKGGHPSLDSMHVPRTSEAELRSDLDASLRVLGTDHVDLYWLHRDDPARPVEHFVDVLNALVDEGKVRTFGASNWSAARLRAAHDYAMAAGRRTFAASQPHWCLGCQHSRPSSIPGLVLFDADAERFHKETGAAVIPYSSQAGGFFSKLALAPDQRPVGWEKSAYNTSQGLAAGKAVAELSRELGVPAGAIVLAYLWSRPFPVVPVVGCRTKAQLEASVAAIPLRLSSDQLQRLERASRSGLL
ncbi:MAG TPA: aldo/keto reductase [Opitutaceae bacterium]|nr:aldo/keto reductase [Opitutaceae bacterium]